MVELPSLLTLSVVGGDAVDAHHRALSVQVDARQPIKRTTQKPECRRLKSCPPDQSLFHPNRAKFGLFSENNHTNVFFNS